MRPESPANELSRRQKREHLDLLCDIGGSGSLPHTYGRIPGASSGVLVCVPKRQVRPNHLRRNSACTRHRTTPKRSRNNKIRRRGNLHARGFCGDWRGSRLIRICYRRNRHICALNSDCTGTATVNYPDGLWIDLELVMINQGNEFRTVVSVLNLRGTAITANIASSGRSLEN